MKEKLILLLVVTALCVIPVNGVGKAVEALSSSDHTSEEAWNLAEAQYAQKSESAGLVKHRFRYVPAEWHKKYGDISHYALEREQKTKRKKHLEKEADEYKAYLDRLRTDFNITCYSKKHVRQCPEKAIDIMILSDGFLEKEMPKYLSYATGLPSALLQTEPFCRFDRDLFNFHIIGVVSQQSGVKTSKKDVKNVFGSTINGNRLAAMNTKVARKYATIIQPQAELVIIVANTTQRVRESAWMGISPGIVTVTRKTSINRVVRHELGHAFGGLADEYVEFQCKKPPKHEPLYPNVTIENNPKKCKWNYWIKAAKNKVGLYEGAYCFDKYHYRPEKQCLMRSGEKFCRVCREAMMMQCYRYTDVVRNIEPLCSHIEMDSNSSRCFSYEPYKVSGGGTEGVWLLDGKTYSTGSSCRVFSSRLNPGRHVLALAFRHKHPSVLRGEEYLERTFFWEIDVSDQRKTLPVFPHYKVFTKIGELYEQQIIDIFTPERKAAAADLKVECLNPPEGAVIDIPSMKFRWRPHTWQRGAHLLQFRILQGKQSDIYLLRVCVSPKKIVNNDSPIIFFAPKKSIEEGSALTFKIQVIDLDHDDVFIDVGNLPEGAEFDSITGEFTWIPGFFQGRDEDYKVVFKATDGINEVRSAVKIRVRDTCVHKGTLRNLMMLAKNGHKSVMRDVEYGLITYDAGLRMDALEILREYYGDSVLVDCLRLMKSRNTSLANSAADMAADIIARSNLAERDGLVKFCLKAIAQDLWEIRDRCPNLDKVLDAAADNENLSTKNRKYAEKIKLQKVGL